LSELREALPTTPLSGSIDNAMFCADVEQVLVPVLHSADVATLGDFPATPIPMGVVFLAGSARSCDPEIATAGIVWRST
jgi:hypothetical protein